jgi:hypothetical protein
LIYTSYRTTYQDHVNQFQNNHIDFIPYFVTKVFCFASGKFNENSVDNVWKLNRVLYTHILSQLIPNYSRPSKRHLQPKSFDFIDVEGSAGTMRNLRIQDSNWPHIHSILFIHENQVEPFEVLMEDGFNSILTFQDRSGNEPFRNLKSIHATPITHDLDRVVGYAAKLLDHPEAKHLMRDFPLYDQMPSH